MDLLSIGDVTEDVFVRIDDATVRCDHKKRNCQLCFSYPNKVAIQKVDKLLGGNAGNMAIGAARLGLKSALYAEVGNDTQGQLIYDSLKQNKVSTKYFYRKKGEKTNYSVVLYYNSDRTILVHHEERKYKFPRLGKFPFVYLTSMGHGSEKLFPKVVSYVAKRKAMLGFNPGTHHIKLGAKKLAPVLRQTHVLFVNREEAQRLLKTKKTEVGFLLKALHSKGPKIAMITDGANGSFGFDGSNMYHCPIYDVPVIERTGAGDAFSTGFMCALFYGKKVDDAMVWGSLNSAGVVQKVGPQNGLITISLLKKVLKSNPKYKCKKCKGEVKTKVYKPKKFRKF